MDQFYSSSDKFYQKENTKRRSHTYRRNVWCVVDADTVIDVKRPDFDYDDPIPVSRIDAIVNYSDNFSLRKKGLFSKFASAINKYSTDCSVQRYKTVYRVPICGHIITKTTKSQKSKPTETQEHFVSIGFRRYSTNFYYTNSLNPTNRFAKLKVPSDWVAEYSYNKPNVGPTEKIFKISRRITRTDSIDTTLLNESMVDTIYVCPSKPLFDKIFSNGKTRKASDFSFIETNSIMVLSNKPGFITRFKLYYRSEATYGKWVMHDIYTCNNQFEPVKIHLGETLMVKEFRVVPIGFVNSWGKCDIIVTNSTLKKIQTTTSCDTFVQYELQKPTTRSKRMDKHTRHFDRDSYEWFKQVKDRSIDMSYDIDDAD